MQVSRVAYDRFELQLPPADPGVEPLADSRVAHNVAGWLWDFGPTPLIAIVEHDGAVPSWLSHRTTLGVRWEGRTAAAVIVDERADLEHLLREGAPHLATHLLWPRVSPAKTFEALVAGGDAWEGAVEGHARVSEPGVIEVMQLQPV